MTKLDFSIHLFDTARKAATGQRVPIVTMLILCIMAKREDEEWISGTDLAAGIEGLNSGIIVSATKTAVEEGILERRAIDGRANGAAEWRMLPRGKRIVEKLLTVPADSHAKP